MSTVYRKIFVTCGIGGLLMLAIGLGLSFLIVSERIADFAGSRTSTIAAQAARAYATGGETALKAWIRAQDSSEAGDHVFVVDENGRDMLDRVVPLHLSKRTQQLFARTKIDAPPGFSPARWVPQMQTRDGVSHAIYVIPRNAGLLERIDLYKLPFVLLALAALISGVVASILARYFSSPIRELAGATRALARGELGARLHEPVTSRRDELGALGRDFNAMAARLDHLLKTREQLIRDMSHELRTPLARLNVALELVRRKDPEQRLASDHGRIQQQVDRLDHMIESILGFARLEALSEPPHFSSVELRELAMEVVEDAQLEAEQRECIVTFDDYASGAVYAFGNAAILRSAIQNVVRNALRHTPQGSRVGVALETRGECVELHVRDQGPGVPAEHLERIFEPFYRVDDSRGRDPGGTGLGLAIVDKVLAAHRGSVRARNIPTGGLEVTLSLPLSRQGEIPWEPDFEQLTQPAPRAPVMPRNVESPPG